MIICLFAFGIDAQTRKASASKKTVTKKNEKQAKDARKDSKKNSIASKNAKKDTKKAKPSAKDKETAKRNDSKRDKLTAKEKPRDKDSKKKLDPKKIAESRKAEAARKRAAEERRQAALAEQRRREQLAREARERKLAFERGLRTETVRNIENDRTDGEDLQVRRAAVNALGSHAGTIVVMEAQTGKVLTIVNQDWAIRNSFKPCSTIKLVTGVAGLDEHVINEEGGIGNSTSGMKLEGALAHSNNGYFQRVGVNVGSSKMVDYARKLGLGEQTGINADGETAGRVPNGNNNPRIYSHGDDFEVTPLQLAVLVSAVSNGGRKVVPQIPIPRVERTNFIFKKSERLDLPKRSFEGLLPGMLGAAEYGTARRGVDSAMGVAGKTGSCIGKGSWVGLFASVAPVEDPKYSVVVITRGQSERGKYAAAIAGQVYQALRSRITRDFDNDWARRNLKPRTVDTQTARSDEDDEDMDEAAANERIERPFVTAVRSNPVGTQPAVKKMVQKTGQSTPVFPPVVITFDRSGAEMKRPRIVKN